MRCGDVARPQVGSLRVAAHPLPGATPAARQSRFRGGDVARPQVGSLRVAAHPLPGATPAARQSRFRGVSPRGLASPASIFARQEGH
ncbi:hypothetical protein APY03_1521 [Variovorax sp. WDL1]|nr:hypothetical protein APY03_1521 [Variovorax sp. WDL1]